MSFNYYLCFICSIKYTFSYPIKTKESEVKWHSLLILRKKTYKFLCFLDIIHNPGTHFSRTILAPTFNLNFRSTHIFIQRSIYSLTNQGAFLLKVQNTQTAWLPIGFEPMDWQYSIL